MVSAYPAIFTEISKFSWYTFRVEHCQKLFNKPNVSPLLSTMIVHKIQKTVVHLITVIPAS